MGDLVLKSNFRFSKMFKGSLKHNILVLGNSRGVNLIDIAEASHLTQSSIFNLSYNGLSMELIEAVLMDYLEHNEHPDLIIIEISSLLQNTAAINDFKVYVNYSSRLRQLLKQYDPTGYYGCRLSHVFCFNSQMFLRSLYYLNKSDQQWLKPNAIGAELIRETQTMPLEAFRSKLKNVQALKRIIDITKKERINLSLILSPYLQSYVTRIKNLPQWIKETSEVVGEDVIIHDYSTALSDNSCFADRLHTNKKGTRHILDMLIRDGVIKRF